MTEKLTFTIEDAKMVSENPDSNFAVLALDFFASGKNLHNMYVSEETLLRTASTIKNCPLVWKYDEKLDDIYTHDKDEVPCGFVPENSRIETKKTIDGRVMLSVIAYVWKRYTGDLLKIFKRDGGNKPVSVEISVFDTRPREDGLLELLDYKYEGITVLGSFVTPAIPSAMASVLSFSEIAKEYEEAYEKEFAVKVNMTIPEDIKSNAKLGLELKEKYNSGGTSVALSFAKYLTKKTEITPEKARYIVEYFSKYKTADFQQSDPPTASYISSLLLGGRAAYIWAKSLIEDIEKEENKMEHALVVTFPYKSIGDMNPALKGISPPITVAQGNKIAKQAESIGVDEDKNGWAIAISNFKKTHVVKDGKWVEKNSKEMAMENEILENAPIEKEVLEHESPVEEETEEEITNMSTEEEGGEKTTEVDMADDNPSKEEEKEEEKKFQFPQKMSMEMMGQMFSDDEDEDDEDVKMAKEQMAKGEFASPEVMMSAMFTQMCRLADKMAKMADQNKVYMEENEELKKFKAQVEEKNKQFEVDKTLQELSAKVVLPDDVRDEMLELAKNFSLENLDEWKTKCKAKSFEFATREQSNRDVVEIGLPFTASTKQKDDLWS